MKKICENLGRCFTCKHGEHRENFTFHLFGECAKSDFAENQIEQIMYAMIDAIDVLSKDYKDSVIEQGLFFTGRIEVLKLYIDLLQVDIELQGIQNRACMIYRLAHLAANHTDDKSMILLLKELQRLANELLFI